MAGHSEEMVCYEREADSTVDFINTQGLLLKIVIQFYCMRYPIIVLPFYSFFVSFIYDIDG